MPDRNLVSGLGGTVIVAGRCNTQIVRLDDTENRNNFLNIWTIFTKFFTNMGNVQMQHICNFEKNISISSLSFLRLNASGHLY